MRAFCNSSSVVKTTLERVLRRWRKICEAWFNAGLVGWQIERMHVLWPAHLAAAMTARIVQHDPNRTLSQLLTQMLQEDLQALGISGGQ